MKAGKTRPKPPTIETTYVYLFKVTTNCPFETEEGVKHALLMSSEGYSYKVEELPVLILDYTP